MSRDSKAESPGYGGGVSTVRPLASLTKTVYSATRGAVCMRVVCIKTIT